MNKALAEQSIRKIEICHYMLNLNLSSLYHALIEEIDTRIHGCGDVGKERLERAFLYARLLTCWVDEADVYPELSALFGQVSALLGDKTDAKISLVQHLIHRLNDNGYKTYPDDQEDFTRI